MSLAHGVVRSCASHLDKHCFLNEFCIPYTCEYAVSQALSTASGLFGAGEEVKGEVTDSGDGWYAAAYRLTKAGKFVISLELAGGQVRFVPLLFLRFDTPARSRVIGESCARWG